MPDITPDQETLFHSMLASPTELLQSKKLEIQNTVTRLRGEAFVLRKQAKDANSAKVASEFERKAIETEREICAWEMKLSELDHELELRTPNTDAGARNFDKYRLFANIRELLKDADVKLGQIEKEAGCQAGYMSRMEKLNNTAEPSVEFVVTAAKLLGVSMDTLIYADLSCLTSTEKYIVAFLEKLQRDTLADKLDWQVDKESYLNQMRTDINGIAEHPLFSYETFYEESECEYPEEVSRVVFISDSFGPTTVINDDCFHLQIKNRSVLYLMDIEKSVHKSNDTSAFAKEVWIYTPGIGASPLAKSNGVSILSDLVISVFNAVKTMARHPHIEKGHKAALDAFMNDDIADEDPFDGLPPF